MSYNQFYRLFLMDVAGGDPALLGEYRYNAGSFRFKDSQGVLDPRTIWKVAHANVPNLAHILGEWCGAAAVRVTAPGPFPTSQTWYYDQAMTKMAANVALTRLATTMQVSQAVTTLYDTDGATVIAQCTDSYTYSGIFETKLVRSWSMQAVP